MGWVEEYDEWYDTSFGKRAFQKEKKLLETLIPIEKGKVLEVGTGTGRFGEWLKERGFLVVGMDISYPMLLFTKKEERVKYLVQADAHHLPFKDSAFDMVMIITSLEFMKEPLQALREVYRVSKGLILLGVLNALSLIGIVRRIKSKWRKSWYSGVPFYNIWRLKKLFYRAAEGDKVKVQNIIWRTTLYPRFFPSTSILPLGGFIGVRVVLRKE